MSDPPLTKTSCVFYKFACIHRVWRYLRRIGRPRYIAGILFVKGRASKSQTELGIRWPEVAKRGQDSKNIVWSRCGRGSACELLMVGWFTLGMVSGIEPISIRYLTDIDNFDNESIWP